MNSQDHDHRTINYLRFSVNDRCSLRCIYCMPEKGIRRKPYHVRFVELMPGVQGATWEHRAFLSSDVILDRCFE